MRSYKGLINRFIKNEKRSVIPIFISIVLTISLITSVVFITQNIMENNFNKQKNLFGDYDVRLQKINSQRLNKLKTNDNVKDYALGKYDQVIVKKSQKTISTDASLDYVGVYAVEKKFLDEYINFNVVEGRLPENKNEIILNKGILSKLSKDYRVGSKVEVNVRELKGKDNYSEIKETTYLQFIDDANFNLDMLDKETQKRLNNDIEVLNDKKVSYTIVGIIDTPINDELFGNKVIRLLDQDEIINSNNEFEAFTYLKNSSKEEKFANDLGLKYILPNLSMKSPFGYPASDVKYPGYDKGEYESLIKNGLAKSIISIIIVFCFMAVYNTFHSSVSKRIKVYGVLRALGATMGQISYLIYGEALLLYAVAAPVGLIIGYVLTKLESYLLINVMGLLQKFTMDFNLEVVLITLISVFLIIFGSVISVLRKEGKLTPIEAIIDARGLTRNKKSSWKNDLGASITTFKDEKEDIAITKELMEYDKTTLKFKIMKKFFKFEGELAHKNITRDVKAHKLTKSTLFIAMAILIFFFLQVVNGTVVGQDITKSDKWDVELSLNKQQFNDDVINKIKNINGVEKVYRWSGEKVALVIPNKIASETLKVVLREKQFAKVDKKTDTQGIDARIITLDDNSIKFYEGVDKESLDNGGILLVNKATNYVEKRTGEGGQQIDYSYLNSDPTLIAKVSDKLLLSEDDSVITMEGVQQYYEDKRPFKELTIVGTVDDEVLYSTANSTDMRELDVAVKLLTTEKGLEKILGGSTNNRILVKTINNQNRKNTIDEINKICVNNNYQMKDIIGEKLIMELNIKENLGLNIIFAITILIMVVLNLINTTNASILSRRKELAGMRAIGMSNEQERRMIIGELFYISLSVAFTIILSVGVLTVTSEFVNLAAGKVSIWTLLIGEGTIITGLMVISTLTSLAPLAQAKKFSIVEDLKED